METKCKKMPVSFFYQKDGMTLFTKCSQLEVMTSYDEMMFQKEKIHLFESKC